MFELFHVIYFACRLLCQKNKKSQPCTAELLLKFISQAKVTTVALTRSDIEELLEMLIYDGKIEKRSHLADCVYKLSPAPLSAYSPSTNEPSPSVWPEWWQRQQHLTSIPCGQCPVFDRCSTDGPITPLTCQYFESWIKM